MSEQAIRAELGASRSAPPHPVATHAGVTSESEHEALRADIRRLSTMLGETLVHHGGPELLELVEQVRRLSRTSPETGGAEIMTLLSGLDTGTAVALTRAFSQYFQLANIAEQRHRSRELRALRPAGHAAAAPADASGWPRSPASTAPRCRTCSPRRAAAGVHRAPHRVVPAVGAARSCAGSPRRSTAARRDEELAALVDLLWQTDEIRPGKPTVADEARAIGWYMEQLARATVPGPARRVRARGAGGRVHRAGRRAAAGAGLAGWAATGTATRTSPRRSPARCWSCTRDRALRIHGAGRGAGRRAVDLHPGVGVSEELRGSLARDRRALPEVHDRFIRLNAHEPYRLKLSYVRPGWRAPAPGSATGAAHVPGRDYLGAAGVPRGPAVLDRSLRGHLGGRIADGTLARALRTARALGLHLAELDIREHSGKHHAALGAVYDALGELDKPYAELTRAERTALLAAELEQGAR